MDNEGNTEPMEVFAGTAWQAGMVKSLLEDAGIRAFLADEIIGTYNPWWTAPGGAGSIRVFVAPADFDEGKAIAAQYDRNLKG